MAIGGLIGLTQNTGKREAARQELNTMMGLVEYKKQQEAEEQQAEIAYNEALAKVQEEANNLLSGDRIAVKQKSLDLQKQMKEKIRVLGGTKKAFLKAGGISDLANYKKELIDSEEFQGFKENKLNMERILLVKEKGLGSRLNQQDLKLLKQYEINGRGKIQYTGLLNEIKVDVQAYELNHAITPEEVLQNNENRMAIIANMEADKENFTYDPSNPTHEQQIKNYIIEKGYGGVGRNAAMLAARTRLEVAKLTAKKKNDEITQTQAWTQIFTVANKRNFENATYQNLDPGGEFGKAMFGFKPDNKVFTTARQIGFGAPKQWLGSTENMYKLRGAASFGNTSTASEVVESLLNVKADDTGKIMLDPQLITNMYDMKGTPTYGKDLRGFDKSWNIGYQPTDFVVAWKTQSKDEEGLILADPVNKKGEIETERQVNMYGDKNELEANAVLLVRLKGENERRDLMLEIPMDNLTDKNRAMDAFGKLNDLKKASEESQRAEAIVTYDALGVTNKEGDITEEAEEEITNNTEMGTAIEESLIAANNSIEQANNSKVLNGDIFDLFASNYRVKSMNRDNLLKSFVLTAGNYDNQANDDFYKTIIQNKAFQTIVSPEMENMMYNEKVKDEDIVNQFYKEDIAIAKPDKQINSYKFATMWMETLKKQNLNIT